VIIRIDDIMDARLAPFASLTRRQLKGEDIFIAESENVILSAIENGVQPISLLCEERHINGKAQGLIEKLGEIPVYTAPDSQLERLTGYALSRGMLCAMRRPKPISAETVLKSARRVAVLESLADSENMGAIFRSAAALGIDGVLLSPRCADVLARRCVRVSMGAVFRIPFAELPELPSGGVELLHKFGFTACALALTKNSIPIQSLQVDKPALILGNEGRGLDETTLAACDKSVIIPMYHGTDSLNVAAAAAVAFWETGKRLEL